MNKGFDPIEFYITQALDPKMWLGQAAQLDYVARSFEADINDFWNASLFPETHKRTPKHEYAYYLMDIHFMLMGFAIENLIKASVIRKKAQEYAAEIRTTGRLPAELKTHKLKLLAQEGDVPLDSHRIELLSRLEDSITSAGRYPVRLTANPKRTSDGFMYYHASQDLAELRQLLEDLATHLGANPQDLFTGAR